MSYDEDQIALAAEYVLGTLDQPEREQVETMMNVDRGFQLLVQEWEGRLGELHAMVDPVEPPPDLFEKIRASLGLSELDRPFVLPEVAPSIVAPVEAEVKAPVEPDNVVLLSDRLRRWRSLGQLTSALAAALIAFISIQALRPDWLPLPLRPPVRVERVVVEAQAPASGPQLVGVLQRDASRPAFLISVDPDAKSFVVRKVNAPAESGKSYELWIISDRLPQPRSLGVIGVNDFTTGSQQLANFDGDMIRSGTYAVTVEQEGGSPTGAPTTAPIFTGRLVPAVPQKSL
jgi:anti-sigma-K factor RskA